jgi:photosystem II stability/assembly factor-like uncharacterized protein
VSRLGLLGLVCLVVPVPSAGAALAARQARVNVTVGPMRLISPGFGYVVAQRTVQGGGSSTTRIRLLVLDNGHWRDASPPALRRPAFPLDGVDAVDDVAFVDRRNGWLATFDCAAAGVHLYRTSDGGRSWRSLGEPSGHSCSAPGTTFLSFVDARHGWMEPVSPTGPVGALDETTDGGRTWKHVATGPAVGPGRSLPCLAPIRFISVSTGWLGRCDEARGGVFSTGDGGRRWRRATIAVPDGRLDVPWFHGRDGVDAATVGSGPVRWNSRTRAVTFSVTGDGGQVWTTRSTRPIASCPLSAYNTVSWPTSVVNSRVWWIVSGRNRPSVQLTLDGGRTWRTVVARGLSVGPCSVLRVSAAGPNDAWVVARTGRYDTALYRTDDGGRDWRRVTLFPS